MRDDATVDVLDLTPLGEGHGTREFEPERQFDRINLGIIDGGLPQNLLHVARVVLVGNLGHELLDLLLLKVSAAGALHGGREVVGDAAHELREGVHARLVPDAAVNHGALGIAGAHDHLGEVELHVARKNRVVAEALVEVVERGGNVLSDKEVHNPAAERHFADVAQGFQALHGLVKVHGEVEKLGVACRYGQVLLQKTDELGDGGAHLALEGSREFLHFLLFIH
ncbi:14.1 kDa early protein [Human adenovirus 4]|uniref:14.1 kDa early protein n=1 Tax=Human adenovirus E serotype 4 TaxID=28280 RepID=Q5GFB8_ADE04|nr:14.1 kDa early protein [Human adenovirus E4]AAT97489.1 14.1 kDa early protein [Human adenovirus E4]QOX73560.1 14.1 kDa early protein [Human adenovirus E4]